MNILSFHKELLDNYRAYINSFIRIKSPEIAQFVNDGLENNKLWLEPLIQFNPTFEKGQDHLNPPFVSFSLSLREGQQVHPSLQ